jgi:hypothetical protein
MFLKLLLVLTLLLALPQTHPAQAADPCPREDSPGCKHGLPSAEYERLLALMVADPEPRVFPIPIDQTQVDSFTFYKVQAGAEIFNAPNGAVIGTFNDGFNFISVYSLKSGFAMLKNGNWLRTSSLIKTFASEFTGVLIDKPLRYPMAWVVQASIPARIPGGNIYASDPAIKRYTRLNIFATVTVRGWKWYLVGPGQWLEQRKLSVIYPDALPDYTPTSDDDHWVAVDLYEQTARFYKGTTLIGATLVASGIPPWNTNKGVFAVSERRDHTPMSGAMGQPDAYSLPSVPYAIFFDGEISLHGTYWHDGFGYKRSHGCVNLSISDARWLYEWSDARTLTVVVWESGQ